MHSWQTMGTGDMAVTRQIDAQTIGKLYAESVRDLGLVRSVHVRETRDCLEIWVVTVAIDLLEEEPLYEAGVQLWDRYPEAGVLIHVVNPMDYPEGHDLVRNVVPSRAKEVAVLG